MFEINVKNLNVQKQNEVLKKNINLDVNLDAFILISSSNSGFAENVLNYTLEHLIDRVGKEDTYQDFSTALENINSFIKTWRLELDNKNDILDMII
ncbi:MAG: hypothetical protein LBQ59_01855 [Candidatus Peribacteria bacterium]|jgi:hypothetical protein|nr:hypothetical protein [Candidatus Peribacteria bacterium]